MSDFPYSRPIPTARVRSSSSPCPVGRAVDRAVAPVATGIGDDLARFAGRSPRLGRWGMSLAGGTIGLLAVVSGTIGQTAPATRPVVTSSGVTFQAPIPDPRVGSGVNVRFHQVTSQAVADQPLSHEKVAANVAVGLPTSPVQSPVPATPTTDSSTAHAGPVMLSVPNRTDAPEPVANVRQASKAAGTHAITKTPDVVPTPPAPMIEGLADDGVLRITANKTQVLHTKTPFTRVSVAQPDVADVNILGPDTLLVTAKNPGTTQMILWTQQTPGDAGDGRRSVDVRVAHDVDAAQEQIDAAFPGRGMTVASLNGGLALRGRVPDLKAAERAEAIVAPFGNVLNLLEVAGGQQVMLHVQFAEVSRSVGTELGVNFGVNDGTNFFGVSPGGIGGLGFREVGTNAVGLGVPVGTSPTSIFGTGTLGGSTFAYFVQALRANNLLRVLAEPNVVAISGQEASFLAGGEFAIPVPSREGIGIEYREFGIQLKFVPLVLGDGRIRLSLSPEVSDLDFAAGTTIAGTRVPGLRKRSLSTVVEMAEGQTFAVAGLLDNSVVANRDVIPLLGDLPILGTLFRSVRYQRRETELVILITPRLVEPLNPGQTMPLPGENHVHPDEAELFLLGRLEGGRKPAGDSTPTPADVDRPAATFHGRRGFQPAGAVATTSADHGPTR